MDTRDKNLAGEIKKGSAAAFSRLFDKQKDVLFSYALKITRSRDLAEETVQEAFLKLWQHRSTIDPDRPVEAYLYRIARNHVFNLLKRATLDEQMKAEVFYSRAVADFAADEHLILSELQQARENAISCLPPRRQLIFKMSRKEGLSHQEIAERLGISRNTVKDQIVKATGAVRQYLQTHGDMAVPVLVILGNPFNF